MAKKTIQMFLMDGTANGRIKASISGWVGLAFKIPRETLNMCNDRPELNYSGVYFLFGKSNGTNKPPVYIGQAGIRKSGSGILSRLQEHDKNPEKNYWSEAVVFITSNNSFGQTELSFLENKFCNKAIAAKRYDVRNANDPTPGNVTEEVESALEEYAEYAELVIGVLGYKVFEPLIDQPYVPKTDPVLSHKIPSLPSYDLKIGVFVRTAMRNLSNSGFVFSDDDILDMTTKEWGKKHFHSMVFLRIVNDSNTSINDDNGKPRFWKEPLSFGKYSVYISNDWYSNDKDKFIVWYKSLSGDSK